ncbi:hypothetical protein GCM10027511_22180 [Hymenobacter humi]
MLVALQGILGRVAGGIQGLRKKLRVQRQPGPQVVQVVVWGSVRWVLFFEVAVWTGLL